MINAKKVLLEVAKEFENLREGIRVLREYNLDDCRNCYCNIQLFAGTAKTL
jgi:hypothetical protein